MSFDCGLIVAGYVFLKNSSSFLYFETKRGETLESIHVSKVLSSPMKSFESHFEHFDIGEGSFHGW